jgi:hypothetical protein
MEPSRNSARLTTDATVNARMNTSSAWRAPVECMITVRPAAPNRNTP